MGSRLLQTYNGDFNLLLNEVLKFRNRHTNHTQLCITSKLGDNNFYEGSLKRDYPSMDVLHETYHIFQNMNNYLSPEARKIVESNPNLMFHFVYGTWNGPGWFRKFAMKINDGRKIQN